VRQAGNGALQCGRAPRPSLWHVTREQAEITAEAPRLQRSTFRDDDIYEGIHARGAPDRPRGRRRRGA
jgi:hypothetical protein